MSSKIFAVDPYLDPALNSHLDPRWVHNLGWGRLNLVGANSNLTALFSLTGPSPEKAFYEPSLSPGDLSASSLIPGTTLKSCPNFLSSLPFT